MAKLTHLDSQGQAQMVDVSQKVVSKRTAKASAVVRTNPETINLIKDGLIKKGDVVAVSRIAGIMAAKKTSELIPLCHPIPVESVNLEFSFQENTVLIEAEAGTTAKTGLEMEVLTAVTVAALTVYDMCKAVDKSMTIDSVKLVKKSGGKSGDFVRKS